MLLQPPLYKIGTLLRLGALFLCLFLHQAVEAQVQPQPPAAPAASRTASGSITGVLLDSASGKPIEYATIALLPDGSATPIAGTLSDAQGRFRLQEVKPGVYALAISFIGYQTTTIRQVAVTEQRPEVAVGTVRLREETATLQEVTVQALRPTITQEADKLVVSVEGTALAAGRTAFEVLANAPGVYIDHEGNIQLNGRSGVTVMLDGKLTYLSARDLRNLLESMPAENLKNIEIITNPSARYDAEGSSGILNINLKKNERQGLNGSAYAGYNYNFKQHGYSAGSSLYHKAGRWNSLLTLDFARRAFGREATFTRLFQQEQGTTYFDQTATSDVAVVGPPSVRAGTEIRLNQRHSLGVTGHYVTNRLRGNFLTDTYLGRAPGQPDRYVDADNYNTNRFSSATGNLHYQGKFDTLGTTLSADLDLVKIRNRGYADFYNTYYTLASGTATADVLHTDTPNGYDILSAKTDYVRPLPKGHKLELGAKASHVLADNDSRFYLVQQGARELDLRRTNHFVYRENIFAAYASWNGKLSERFTLQAGLRAEQTQSEGESLTTGQVTRRSYLNLFPSVFLQQKLTDNYSINYSYGHRIQRPNYGQLNPFFAYRDPYTYWQGNPYLRPQFAHVVAVTQVFRKTYQLTLNYQRNLDLIAELPAVDAATATTVYYIGNVDHAQSLGLTALLPLRLRKFWETSTTASFSYQEYVVTLKERQLINHRTFYLLQQSHNLLLPHKLKLEVNATYQSASVHALYRIEPRWWVNAGLRRSFAHDKLDLSLNVNDIFKSQRLLTRATLGGGNVSDFNQYFRNRSLSLTLRYRFSAGAKVDEQQRSTNLEELNRTR